MLKKLFVNIYASLVFDREKRHMVREVWFPKRRSPNPFENFVNVEGFYDVGGSGWASYMLTHNMPEMLADLRKGLDEESNKLLDTIFSRITIFPEGWWNQYRVRESYMRSPLLQTPEEAEMESHYCRLLPRYRSEFLLDEDQRNVDTFLYHSGLAGKNAKIKNYIAGKDFIDGGAYIGDTALIYIRKYNSRIVYSFEISAKSCARYENTMRINGVQSEKYKLVHMGLFDKKIEITLEDSADQGTTVLSGGNDKVCLTDLDSFVKQNALTVGFIKADLEGVGLEGLLGMAETIRRDRPVLCISIYHNPKEFFEIKPALDKVTKGLNYKITLEKHFPFPDRMVEVVVFAYPSELS